ncbi:MAG: cysteine biosynthesis protein CysZ [Hyphomicrobiales bacterium]|nr:MAG: cysteine biosynthesis protein CysZ [Hyphomicrobiales bacterium]
MLSDASKAFSQVFTPPFRAVLWKSLGLTIALLIGLFVAAEALLTTFLALPFPWLDTIISVVAGLGLFVGLGFLIAPVTSIFAGLFLDEIAEVVEKTDFPQDPPGKAMPLGKSLLLTVKFAGVVILVNIGVLLLLLLPGVNLIAFFVANGYLLGREYFEFAAMRFMSPRDARRFRRENGTTVFLAGLVIAGVLAVPILNLITPLFATAFMVRLNKRLSGSLPANGGF